MNMYLLLILNVAIQDLENNFFILEFSNINLLFVSYTITVGRKTEHFFHDLSYFRYVDIKNRTVKILFKH